MTVVLVAGVAGGLGHRTALACTRLPGTTVRGLDRSLSPSDPETQKVLEALKAAGVDLMEGDLLQPGTLGPAVAGVDVVVSCVMGDEAAMVDGQASLLNAAKAAGFVASTFSVNVFALDRDQDSAVCSMALQFADILKDSGMPHLHINVGITTECFWGVMGLYCHEDGTLRYYGSPDQKLDVTTSQDTLSINDVAAAYKEVYGKELPSKCLGSIDDLAEELSRRMQADPSAWQICVPLMYQRVVFDGSAKLQHVANDRYPDVHPTDMRSFLRQHPDLAAVAWWPDGTPLPPEFYRK
ncbi:hypothetical protein CHLNCDRAFT_133245 [Chlorella variabilis]|uniref:NmrA-like domain-containing protein n=1 Tax=Chlorella variabilis TaxID=554065 RepID=E1Z2P3_CHLVA|nr:hypothetical protein CHLNCDRAFT_133245 [Chlorella variabilis]EFN60032.1 hypothetical protein CHLNCDRAFT_133245 [Chlorella variabilis]|eukprot:XP_005852134.1 hypothetical protein CHLNCDRAFT_133245 [Chlorella variabilis]